jgi:hypothetical protein
MGNKAKSQIMSEIEVRSSVIAVIVSGPAVIVPCIRRRRPRYRIASRQPAVEVDVGASLRAERVEFRH